MRVKHPGGQSHVADANRREFLAWGLVATALAVAAKFIGVSAAFSRPRIASGELGGVFELGPAVDLGEVGAAPVNVPEGRFVLTRTDAGILALQSVCTHLDCLVAWEESGDAFVCPCHGSRFARDGSPLSGPASRALDRFPVLITDSAGTVVAETDVSTGAPLALPQSQPPAAMDEAAPADDPDDPEESEEAIPDDLLVLVDTGRKIIGTPFAPA